MSEFLDRISNLSPKRLALLAAQLNEQVQAAAARAREPIAIIGMGCRLPGGADNPQAFWELLRDGRDAVREVPVDRWDVDALYDPDPDAPGRMSARAGGFLDRVGEFDPEFFSITPREALTLDPQQRLLLEVTWEALEDAGVAPSSLSGSATGVFVGICNSDHFQRVLGRGTEEIDAYLASGNALSVAAGRLSYFLGLNGPAMSVDTSCSSSLVALHVGCQSLRRGESQVALVGGVNVMCAPETTIALSRAHMLAPDGRCKPFDAAADGFSRGEGCGVVILKRLSDALKDGDRIQAVIRGTAVNQDGKSGGLTVPSGPAQEAVIRAALADASIAPADIGYVEAHGTGTSLGDPIEVRALAGALGPGRAPGNPLVIGSVKTNFGHLESAAGIAGLMKVVLSLQHERIPRHLHFRQPSPHIAWSEYPVIVAGEGRSWPRGERRRFAGVSSFGFSGTNAHVVIEEAPTNIDGGTAQGTERPLHCLPLSARTAPALSALAAECEKALGCGVSLGDAAHTAGVGRSHFSERVAVVAPTGDEAREALRAFAKGQEHPALHRGTAVPGTTPEVVFLFTGQGSQYPGMGRGLYEASPVFRDVIHRCDAVLGPDDQGRTLTSVIAPGPTEGAPIHDTAWTQPALFAIEYGVSEVWRSWGIEPAAVIGHSAGEYVAACVAGVFSMEDGLRLVAERGRLLQALPQGGAMAALFAPVDVVAAAVAPVADRVAIAAVNAADSAVISGDVRAVEALLLQFEQRNVKGHRLFVSFAAHSPLVESAMAAMEACARKVPMEAPKIPVAWNVTGGVPLPDKAPDGRYWARHLREAVRFADGLTSLRSYGAFLEVGPHPVLMALAERSLPEGRLLLASLRRGKDDLREMYGSLAKLYACGARIDFAGVDRPHGLHRTTWPRYPFQRRTFWIQPSQGKKSRRPVVRGANPLLGERLSTATPIFEATLTADAVHYLGEHRIDDAVLVAGAVFLEMAQAAARAAEGPAVRAVTGFVIREPLVLPEQGRVVQTHLTSLPEGETAFAIHSRAASGGEWLLHATGTLVPAPPMETAEGIAVADVERALGAASPAAAFYERLVTLGIRLGDAFRGIQETRHKDGEVLATVALPASCAGDTVAWVHPSLLDAALRSVSLAVPTATDGDDLYLFAEVERIQLRGPLPLRFFCHAHLREAVGPRPAEWLGDVTLRGTDGKVLGALAGVRMCRASRETLARLPVGSSPAGLFYEVTWEPAPAVAPAVGSLRDPGTFIHALRARFQSLAQSNNLGVYETLLPELDRASAAYVATALRRLGFDETRGRSFTAALEAQRLGVAARHGRLFGRLLEMLVEDGVLRARGNSLEIAAPLPVAMLPERHAELLERFGRTDGELSFLHRAGVDLAHVLRGEQEPLALLFPGGEFREAKALYVESPSARTYNGALVEALTRAIADLPAGARLRVLEIGAGTGSTTTYVLPQLPADRTEYTFTDVSPLFLERAAEAFGKYPFVKRALLDIERDPRTQGFEPGAYDVVIAANVLHATADLRRSVEHARDLLASGGLLLALEGVSRERWVDLTFGLTEGWWRFTDVALRPSYPLIARHAWLELLSGLGFTSGAVVPEDTWTARGGQQVLLVARAPLRKRRFTLVGKASGTAAALARRLEERGDAVTLIPADSRETTLGPADDVVYLGALDLGGPSRDMHAERRSEALACVLPLAWLARIAENEQAGRVWLVTQGAQPVLGAAAEGAEWQAPLWGVGRVFALEQPARWGGLVDLPADASAEEQAAALIAAIDPRTRIDDAEDQTAWRNGARFASRLVHATVPESKPPTFRADATYLVTGGFGGLGLLVARWLAEHGARHVALLGRRPNTDSDAIHAIEALGARVLPLAGDVADEVAMTAIAERLRSGETPPLRGILHAAADVSSAPIGELSPEQITAMLRPKMRGTVLLDRLAPDLDFLVLFSSAASLLGAWGLAHYAAANAFLDAFAGATNRPGRRVLSVNWGAWEVMRQASAESQQAFREGGLLPMASALALDALGWLLPGGAPQSVVAKVDWSIFKPVYEARRTRRFVAHLGLEPVRALNGETGAGSETGFVKRTAKRLVERIAGAPAGERRQILVEAVTSEVAAVLGIGGDQAVPPDTGLFELGMDSLMSVELRKRLERLAGRTLPSTLTFNYPSVNALATFLHAEMVEPAAEPAPIAVASSVADVLPTPAVDLDELDDAAVEARLRARLERYR